MRHLLSLQQMTGQTTQILRSRAWPKSRFGLGRVRGVARRTGAAPYFRRIPRVQSCEYLNVINALTGVNGPMKYDTPWI